jgi:hypothetical protein
LDWLLARDDARLYPTQGTSIDDPRPFVQSLIEHRRERERQVLAELARGPARIREMVPRMYKDVPAYLHPAAARSVLAHLLHLCEQGRVITDDALGLDATYRLAS